MELQPPPYSPQTDLLPLPTAPSVNQVRTLERLCKSVAEKSTSVKMNKL